MKLLLASASPARRQTLINAGITPLVAISHVPEAELLAKLKATDPDVSPAAQVQLLATAKAHDIAQNLAHLEFPAASTPAIFNDHNANPGADTANTNHESLTAITKISGSLPVIVGCDSMFAFAGEVVGKPHTPEIARARLRKMRGNFGDLYTGHCVIDPLTGRESTGVSVARVYIGQMSDREIDTYLDSGEPLKVAGSFTIDGYGGPFVEKIEGDHHGVVGISLPLLRKLLADLNFQITDFWN
ncbi:nucleoside triphosphate pyrophosphatase [Arcanobacterium hippocoleae]|uniref:Nucleoside triphosphate pyrophosphatase n=1 Tax=Arcanobacterium hippocoleae TaxID=149017 RepID=A0ABU1T4Y9_9ACTO|nr:nucleoside triphosphate pyrophosphatase [Arcanobacterium hippocoleae]MDR6939946.1 septum formation protein [Arcanobacterium hippocoleae]